MDDEDVDNINNPTPDSDGLTFEQDPQEPTIRLWYMV
jgi:hypothetical protein